MGEKAISQCGGATCGSTITTGPATIASATIACVNTNSNTNGNLITVNGTLMISGNSNILSNITLNNGGIVRMCGSNNTLTFGTLAATASYQIIIDPGATGNTINKLSLTGSGILTLVNNLTGTDFVTINAAANVSLSSNNAGNTFIHMGKGITIMGGNIVQTNSNSFTLNIAEGDLRIGANNGVSVDYNTGSGAGSIINVSAGARLTTTGSLDFGGNVSTTGGLNNQGTSVIGVNTNGWSTVKRSGNNVPFTNGSPTNLNAVLIMKGGIDINGGNGTYLNYGHWAAGTSIGNGADANANAVGMSVNGNQANQAFLNFGTFTFSGGLRTGGGTAWALTNYGNMYIGRAAAFGGAKNTSVYSGDFMTITNGSTGFPSAILTFSGAIYTTTTNTFRVNNYGCMTARNIASASGNSITLNLYGGSNLIFTGTNSLAVTSAASQTVNYSGGNAEVAIGDVITTTASGIARIISVNSATAATINTGTALVSTYNTVYSLISNLGGNSFSLATTTSPSGNASIQLNGLGIKAGNVTKTGTGTLSAYLNSTPNPVTSATINDPGMNVSSCGPVITAANTLTALTTCQGTASAPASFAVSGINMSAGILVDPPAGFEVSLTSASGYGPTVIVPAVTSGLVAAVPSTLVYIRLTASAAAGTYSGNITLSSSGASTLNIPMPTSVVSGTPGVLLSSPSPDLAAAGGNTCDKTVNDPVFNFQLDVSSSPGILNQVNFTSTGTNTAADISNYKLWYNPLSNSLTGATQIGLISTVTGAGGHSFSGLSQSLPAGSSAYFFITIDIPAGATTGRTIKVSQMVAANVTFQCGGTITGSTIAGGAGTQTITVSGLTVTPSSALNPAYYGNSVVLSANAAGGSGTYSYSWSSSPALFTGTGAASTAMVTPVVSPVIVTVLVGDGYCFRTGTFNESVSIPYAGYTNGTGAYNINATNLPSVLGYSIPANTIYVYNYNTGSAPLTASTNGALDYADNDAASNGGGNYRSNTGVDFENNGGVYNVSNTVTSEFLAFTVNIATAGTYTVTYAVANGGSAQTNGLKLQLDGTDIANTTISVPNTTGWANYQNVSVSGITFAAGDVGIHTLKLIFLKSDINIRSISFGCPSPTAAVISPASATVCSGGTVNLSVAITGGSSPYTVVYTDGSSNFTVNNYVSGAAIPVLPPGNKTYTLVSVTSSCGTPGTGLSGSAVITVSATLPSVMLASPAPNLASASGNNCRESTKSPLYNFQLTNTSGTAMVSQVNFTTTGTHTAADIDNYKLWYNAVSNSLTGAVQIGTPITSSTGAGSHSFTGLSQNIGTGVTGYFIITMDISAAAVINHTIQVSAFTTANVVLACGGFSGNSSAGGLQTIAGTLSVSPTSSLNPAYYGSTVTLSAGLATTIGGITAYSWSSTPAAFSGTASTSTATLTPSGTSVIATVTATNGYCIASGSITQIISIPYGGTAQDIPGKVEAEKYDVGGEGISYHEIGSDGYSNPDVNLGTIYSTPLSTYRNASTGEGIDTYMSGSNGASIGWIRNGEWIKYSVNATTAGTYTVGAYMATDGAPYYKYMEIYIDGVYAGIIGAQTSGYSSFTNSSSFNIPLTAGPHLVAVYFYDACGCNPGSYNYEYFNLDYLTFCLSPIAYNVTGSGSYCSFGGAGLPVTLDNSQINVSYELVKDGTTTGIILPGTGNPLSFGLQTAGTYTILATTAVGLCSTTMNGAAIVAANLPGGVWLGTTSSDWNVASNWCGGMPTSATDVVISSGAPNFPVLSTGAAGTVHNLTINTGPDNPSLTITGNKLQIYGVITNNSVFNATAGTIELIGTGIAQSISGSAFINKTINSLIISNTSGVNVSGVVNDTLNIIDSLVFGNVNGTTLNTGNNITLRSTAIKTARVADITNGGVNSGNLIIGNVIVERYIPAQRKWRLLTAPLTPSSAPTYNVSWQEGAVNPDFVYANHLDPHPGYGTLITGTLPPSSGFDPSPMMNPSVKYYNGSTNQWVGIPNTLTGKVTDFEGYMVFVRGDRSNQIFLNTAAPLAQTILRAKGQLKTGTQTVVVPAAVGGYTVVGNPFASSIDMRKMTTAGSVASNTFITWDPSLTGTQGVGAYQYFTQIGLPGSDYTVFPGSSGTGGGSYGANGSVNNFIQSGQAFILQKTSLAGSVIFNENIKAASGTSAVFRPGPGGESDYSSVGSLSALLSYENNDNTTTLVDGGLCLYNNSFSDELDINDVVKFPNTSSENFGIDKNGTWVEIERRKLIKHTDTIFYKVKSYRVRNYQLVITGTNIHQPNITGYLQDKYLHRSIPVDLNGTINYKFSVTLDSGAWDPARFRIVFKKIVPLSISIKGYSANSNINIEWHLSNDSQLKSFEVQKSSDGINFFTLTTVNKNAATSFYKWIDKNPESGINYYRIKSIEPDENTLLSNIIKVAFGQNNFTVSPNPVTGGKINISFVNQSEGKYILRLFSNAGQLIKTEEINYTGGSQIINFVPDYKLSSGTYRLEILKPQGDKVKILIMF